MSDIHPVDGAAYGSWVRAGGELWNTVGRTWSVFRRNSEELLRLLNLVESNFALSINLMNGDPETTAPFWGELDQRIHNEVASAATLIDITRRLTRYYRRFVPSIIDEFTIRNAAVAGMNEAGFIRDLRNYLLHFDVPPIIQSMSLGQDENSVTGFSLKLSAARLLKWSDWERSKEYLSSFPEGDGPSINRDVAAYVEAMSQAYGWLFSQRIPINNDPQVLDRFRIKGQ